MEKIKQFSSSDKAKDILVVIIIILVGLGSFGLGRLSKNSSDSGIKIEYSTQSANAIGPISQNQEKALNTSSGQNNFQNTQKSNSKDFFASNRGSKYYSLGCSGGKNIKQENRIYFTTTSEAERAGYELSSLCK